MQLSENTVNILKNFAGINANLVFKPGQALSTISEAKTIMAKAQIDETFGNEFGVYDLNEFLSVMNLVDAPVLTFEDKSILISNNAGGVKKPNSTKVRYYYSELDILTQPSKDINMPECEVIFDSCNSKYILMGQAPCRRPPKADFGESILEIGNS